MTNSGFCFFHDPNKAKERAAARRAGGIQRSRRVAVLPPDTPDRPLTSSRELADLLRDMINKILRGELDPKIGYVVTPLAALYMKVLAQAETADRLPAEESRRKQRVASLHRILESSLGRPIVPTAGPSNASPVDLVNGSTGNQEGPEDPEDPHGSEAATEERDLIDLD